MAFQVAIDDHDLQPGDTVYIAAVDGCTMKTFALHHSHIIDQLRDHACDFVGEHSSNWLGNVSTEAGKDLQNRVADTLDGWATEHNLQPNFYRAENPVIRTVRTTDGKETP